MKIGSIEYRGFNINIHQDEDAENPRTAWDNAGTMVCFHNRYDLGDGHNYSPGTLKMELASEVCPGIDRLIDYWENGNGWERFGDSDKSDAMIEKAVDCVLDRFYIILPLYLYDHSGITMNTSGFGCPWDSGQVGIIFITRKQAKEEWPGDDYEERAINYLKGEVEVYDQYLTGEVYGYTIEPTDRNKNIECDGSCWGFYGYEYAMKEMVDDAKSEIDHAIKEYKETTVARVMANRKREDEINQLFSCCWSY